MDFLPAVLQPLGKRENLARGQETGAGWSAEVAGGRIPGPATHAPPPALQMQFESPSSQDVAAYSPAFSFLRYLKVGLVPRVD